MLGDMVSQDDDSLRHTRELWVDRSAEGVLRLTLNRPSRRNALSFELVELLAERLWALRNESETRVVVLSGVEGAFCSGADLSAIDGVPEQEIPTRIDLFHRMILGIADAPQPVIAQIEGPAAGFGADLALACDLRVMAEGSFLEESFVRVGLMPDGGGTYFLPRFMGPVAFEYLALGKRISAAQCQQLGIANRLVSSADLDATVDEYVQAFLSAAPLALRKIKRAVRETQRDFLKNALSRERAGQTLLLRSQDFNEGVRAFMSKSPAQFSGR